MTPTRAAGRFFDGRTAVATSVIVEIGTTAIEIRDGTAMLARWPRDKLRVAGRRADGAVALALEEAEARLVVDAALAGMLAIRDDNRQAFPRVTARTLWWVTLVGAGIVVGGAALWFAWPPLADRLAALIPAPIVDSIGQTAMSQLIGHRNLCQAPAGAAALQKLTDRLARTLDPPATIQVRVVDDKLVNAFAAPGGYIVLFRGLITTASSADEIAGVLAHEIGHVVAGHPMRLVVRYSGLSLAATLLWGDTSLTTLSSLLVTLSYSRTFEGEADSLATNILGRAGIDSRGLSRFFARIEKEESLPAAAALRYLSTHPPSRERRDAVERVARPGSPALSPEDWTALQQICEAS